MTLINVWPYITLVLGFICGVISTKTKVKNTFLSVEINHKEAETKKILVETAQAIAKIEEKGGAVKIRSQEEQAILADDERKRVKELVS